MSFLGTILDIIFPVNCVSCKKSGQFLCSDCLISSKEAERESPDWVFPMYDYRYPPIRKAIWLLKYKGKKEIANIFAKILHFRILEELADLSQIENFREPILIPIPLSSKRQRERGFNQALLICENLVKIDQEQNFKLESNVLVKTKNTEHQADISNRSNRLKNLIGSFSVKNEKLVKGRNVILIDDVTTTGATLNEARKVLKQAGTNKIIAFTIAH